MKKIALIVLIFVAAVAAKAQDYNTGIGIRLGPFSGVTLKHFLGEGKAVEGILNTRYHGFSIHGLIEFEKPLGDVSGLSWYFGFGGHIGFYDRYNFPDHYAYHEDIVTIGADGILGIEYTFEEIPLNLSIDWKPQIDLIGYGEFWGDGFALSARYIF
ncbi:MAG: hypothetical protein A2W91_10505 [Bacteroidetes bacterium GWF2_38_335]|nr:MAG: hypothetical protein A2W91_10505 [Bacteroidetes bacterium GWF2_38_335]OFY81865.1 MAG: hypothetical protein A2281_06535 [Bacteroidetes bacterium RIFOXYA12_FULL_38_20]HBS87942.1 hypothetical protein [Bacteroidales bacterium]